VAKQLLLKHLAGYGWAFINPIRKLWYNLKPVPASRSI
jgi:high-affinity nickel permease